MGGLLKYNDDNTWEVAADVNTSPRRLYSFGDWKSSENCTAFVSTLSRRPVGGVIGRARGGGRLGHGGVFVFFLMSQVFFLGEKKRVGGKNKVGPKKLQCVLELIGRPWVSERLKIGDRTD